MFWRPLITSRLRSNVPRILSKYSTEAEAKSSPPLRILFCGSDEFSCASLTALHDEHQQNRKLIQSIDVVVRPGKPTGRGYKTIRNVPLEDLANNLGLRIHKRDTFTGWSMPRPEDEPISLIIAVSFGLFVPPRLLREAKFGGLNVHPSLLPDLRGPAPIHHALLLRRPYTGISVQTLSPTSFDTGTILAQTPLPGVPVAPDCSFTHLHDSLAQDGARLLVDTLRKGLHLPPHVPAGWLPTPEEATRLAHAPKIRPADRMVMWMSSPSSSNDTPDRQHGWTAQDVATRARVLGPLWSRLAIAFSSTRIRTKRVILEEVEEVPKENWPQDLHSFLQAANLLTEKWEMSGTLSAHEKDVLQRSKILEWVQDEEVRITSDRGEEDRVTLPLIPIKTPYFPQEDGSIVVPARGGCIRIGRIKVEGDRARPAVGAIGAFSRDVGSSEELPSSVEDARRYFYFESFLKEMLPGFDVKARVGKELGKLSEHKTD